MSDKPLERYSSLTRRANETDKAYNAFLVYIGLGIERSLEKTRVALLKKPSYYRLLQDWSSRHEWKERLRAYQAELEQEVTTEQREILTRERRKYLTSFIKLNEHVAEMVTELQAMKITKRTLIDDPRDAGKPENERRQIERVVLKVNTRDLETVIKALGTLNKDVRTALGMPNVTAVDITSKDKGIAWPTIIEVGGEDDESDK